MVEAHLTPLRPIALALFLLAGCSGPTTLLSDVNISGRVDPPPANYKQLVAQHLLVKDEIAMISAPEPGMPWGVTDAKGWYVCVMRGAKVSAIYIAGGRIMGSIDAPEHVCGPGTVYEEFSRGY